ncbi:MAG: germination protein YpeB [Clostridia bacterium]|nr:germination protein YpeB [Clostridia bacterium]
MKKRTVIRIISFMSAVCLTGYGFFIKERNMNSRYKLQVQNSNIESLNTLEESLNNITETLNKTAYIEEGSDLITLTTKLFTEGEIAKNALSDLPNGTKNSATLYKFLSQVGNYSISCSKTAIEKGKVTDEQSDMMLKLYETSRTISNAFNEINKNYDNLDELTKMLDENIEKKVDIKTLAGSLDGIEESLKDYPTLIYDGPFSDHILSKNPIMLANEKSYSKEDCRKRAESVFGLKSGSLKYNGEQNGNIECYRFENDGITVSVTKTGRYIEYMRNSRDVENNKITNEKAIEYAEKFLEKLAVKNMKKTYYYADEGVCVINYAYMSGDTLCYTDLIKIGVALDNGEIMLFESSGFLTNHTPRPFDKLPHTVDEARAKVSKKLSIVSSKLCLIPTDSGKEVRCYEFLCKTKENQQILVYIGVKNLSTENILILQKSSAGTVVK